jgi:hypothetical protein
MNNKIVVYRNKGEFHLIVSLSDESKNVDYKISQGEYDKSVGIFRMEKVESDWQESYETTLNK